jgi:hypothetical protein
LVEDVSAISGYESPDQDSDPSTTSQLAFLERENQGKSWLLHWNNDGLHQEQPAQVVWVHV